MQFRAYLEAHGYDTSQMGYPEDDTIVESEDSKEGDISNDVKEAV
jgi:hypothetical protein